MDVWCFVGISPVLFSVRYFSESQCKWPQHLLALFFSISMHRLGWLMGLKMQIGLRTLRRPLNIVASYNHFCFYMKLQKQFMARLAWRPMRQGQSWVDTRNTKKTRPSLGNWTGLLLAGSLWAWTRCLQFVSSTASSHRTVWQHAAFDAMIFQKFEEWAKVCQVPWTPLDRQLLLFLIFISFLFVSFAFDSIALYSFLYVFKFISFD